MNEIQSLAMSEKEKVTYFASIEENNMPWIRDSLIKPCAQRENCCHCGEGCGLGYPMDAHFGREIPNDVKMLYSKEFKEYWETTLDKKSDKRFLPCAHKGCESIHECSHLTNPLFMPKGR